MRIHKNNFFAVDLFAGCGGLSEGFIQAGFQVIAQVEMDKWACKSLKTRHLYWELRKIGKGFLYHRYLQGKASINEILNRFPEIKQKISCRVIQAAFGDDETEQILERIESSKKYHGASKIHVLLGGPPCQPYSIAGRARDPFRMENDGRHYLYRYYLEIIERLQPDFFVYENVPGLFTARARGREIFSRMLEDFSSLNPAYEITPPLERIYEDPCSYILDSADFKIPQSRKRLFLVGYRKSLERRSPNIKEIFTKLQKKAIRKRKLGHLTVRDAIDDLPSIRPGEGSDKWYGRYDTEANQRSYRKKMRKESAGIINHRARPHMKDDLKRYRFFIEHQRNGNGAANLKVLMKERPELVPEHKHLDKFFDRFRVQWWDRPSSTITAHICKDGHHYIHPDIHQCRSFTVREAARCQSFPDNFKFEGFRTNQFKQVGNAVPPLLARIVAGVILKELRKIHLNQEDDIHGT